MTCHGPTRIEDAVAVDARKSHCLCRSTCYWHAVLHLSNTCQWAAGGQGLELQQHSSLKQNQQTTEVAPQLALQRVCISRENLIAWMSRNHGLQDCRIQHVIKHKKNQVKLEEHQDIQSWHASQ
jgi:hypothetical protein